MYEYGIVCNRSRASAARQTAAYREFLWEAGN